MKTLKIVHFINTCSASKGVPWMNGAISCARVEMLLLVGDSDIGVSHETLFSVTTSNRLYMVTLLNGIIGDRLFKKMTLVTVTVSRKFCTMTSITMTIADIYSDIS